jgi:hypothetical protein
MIIGYCQVCDTPITAYHSEAGAMAQACSHAPQYIVWLAAALAAAQPKSTDIKQSNG